MTTVTFDGTNYVAKVGNKTIKSYSKAYVERKVKAMAGDLEEAMVVATEKSNRFDINTKFDRDWETPPPIVTGKQFPSHDRARSKKNGYTRLMLVKKPDGASTTTKSLSQSHLYVHRIP